MNAEDKTLWSKPSFDISFVEKELSSGSPTLAFLTSVGGVSAAWGRAGSVMKTSRQQCVKCGNSRSALERQPCLPCGFRSCQPRQMSGKRGSVPLAHWRLKREDEVPAAEERGWIRRPHPALYSQRVVEGRRANEVVCGSFSEKGLLRIVYKAWLPRRGSFPFLRGARPG